MCNVGTGTRSPASDRPSSSEEWRKSDKPVLLLPLAATSDCIVKRGLARYWRFRDKYAELPSE
jgi:hypothetical protein